MKKYQMPFPVHEPPEGADDGERPFLICRHNRVGDKYRSPWTNQLYTEDGKASSSAGNTPDLDEMLLELEAKFNGVWEAYVNLYYGHDAVGSVYLSETEAGEWQGFFAVQKKSESGSWSSMHLVHMDDPTEKTCNYRVASEVLMILTPTMQSNEETTGDLSAYVTKDTSKTLKIQRTQLESSHIENIGKLIESNEIDLRSNLERVHIPNTEEIVDTIQKEPVQARPVNPLMGMIMESDVLKKKLAKETKGDVSPDKFRKQWKEPEKVHQKHQEPNPMNGLVLQSEVLRRKLAKESGL